MLLYSTASHDKLQAEVFPKPVVYMLRSSMVPKVDNNFSDAKKEAYRMQSQSVVVCWH